MKISKIQILQNLMEFFLNQRGHKKLKNCADESASLIDGVTKGFQGLTAMRYKTDSKGRKWQG
jgi:hypothetical protein